MSNYVFDEENKNHSCPLLYSFCIFSGSLSGNMAFIASSLPSFIECLKKSGLEIKDIKQFFIWVSEGSSSYEKRKELFETRKSAVETEIQELQKTLSLRSEERRVGKE